MKSATVAFGLFAGMASASYNQHPRHFHNPYWRRNETNAASTTLTVAVTTVHTITSCAPTITNCPANSGNSTGPAVVTEVIDLTTTVCPVTAAESISSSMVGAHSSGLITGSTRTVTATPTSTGASSPEGTQPGNAGNGGASAYPSVGTVDQTVTMTLGPESSRSVLVTTLKSTFTEMVTVTAVPVASNSGNSGNSGSGSEGGVTSQEGTTTTTMTSTGTRTVTVAPAGSSSGVSAEETGSGSNSGSGSGNGSGSGEGECVASTVTVTETQTIPATTVYVTAPVAAEATGAKAVTSEAAASSSTPSTGSNDSSSGDNNEEDDCPPEESDSGVVTATATATVVPYPTGNGTVPTYPSGAAIPTVVLRH